LYSDSLGLPELLPKIAALRKELGTVDEFVPQPVQIPPESPENNKLYIVSAFDERAEQMAYSELRQNPMSPKDPQTPSPKNSPSGLQSPRDSTPEKKTSRRNSGAKKDNQNAIKDVPVPKPDPIDPDEDVNMNQGPKLAQGDTSFANNNPVQVPSPEKSGVTSDLSEKDLDMDDKSEKYLPSAKVNDRDDDDLSHSPEEQEDVLRDKKYKHIISNGGRSPSNRTSDKSIKTIKTPKDVKEAKDGKTKKDDKSKSAKSVTPPAEKKPEIIQLPEPDKMVVDDINTADYLVDQFLRREYVAILNQIEIEDEFNNIDVDKMLEAPFYENRMDDDEDYGRPPDIQRDDVIKDSDLELMLENDPNDKYAHYRLGEKEIERESFSEKLKYHFTKVHKIDPLYMNHIVEQALGEIYFKDKNFKIAFFFFDKCLSNRHCDRYHILVRVAQCYSKLMYYENAHSAYERVDRPFNLRLLT